MDNLEYGQVLTGYLLNSLVSIIPPDIVLKKVRKTGVVTKINPKILRGDFDINRYLNYEQYNDVVLRFHQILETKLSHCRSNAFYQNIKKLSIKEVLLTKMQRIIMEAEGINKEGTYDGQKNRITIFGRETRREPDDEEIKDKEDRASHELLHMASTYKKGPIILMGFKQSFSDTHSIGNGLNEGYTERLNVKYFTHKKISNGYKELQFISEGIESIVGVQKMEKLYFAADLKGLITELAKYSSEKQALDLIRKIDVCHMYEDKDYEIHQQLSQEIRLEIANIYAAKQRYLLSSDSITEEECEDNIFKNSILYVQGYKVEKVNNDYGIRIHTSKAGNIFEKEIFKKMKEDYLSDSKETIMNFDSSKTLPHKKLNILKNTINEKKDLNNQYTIDNIIDDNKVIKSDEVALNIMLYEDSISQNKTSSTKK